MKKQDIDKIIHDKFITLLDKETINNISLLNHHLYGTLVGTAGGGEEIDENYSFDFSKIADEVRGKLDNISDINNDCFYNSFDNYWYTDNKDNLINNEDYIFDNMPSDEIEIFSEHIYKITRKEILTSLLGFELLDTIY